MGRIRKRRPEKRPGPPRRGPAQKTARGLQHAGARGVEHDLVATRHRDDAVVRTSHTALTLVGRHSRPPPASVVSPPTPTVRLTIGLCNRQVLSEVPRPVPASAFSVGAARMPARAATGSAPAGGRRSGRARGDRPSRRGRIRASSRCSVGDAARGRIGLHTRGRRMKAVSAQSRTRLLVSEARMAASSTSITATASSAGTGFGARPWIASATAA